MVAWLAVHLGQLLPRHAACARSKLRAVMRHSGGIMTNRFRRRARQLVSAAIVCIVCAASCTAEGCTEEEKKQFARGLVYVAMVGQLRTDCGFTKEIDAAPVV